MTTTDTGQPHLLTEQRGHVLVVTMNRPQVRNALSGPMLALLRKAWDQVDTDPAIRVCVLTGAGGAFCAGGDVKTFAAEASQPSADPDREQRQLASQLATSGRMCEAMVTSPLSQRFCRRVSLAGPTRGS